VVFIDIPHVNAQLGGSRKGCYTFDLLGKVLFCVGGLSVGITAVSFQ
jgi:hypothetical protein